MAGFQQFIEGGATDRSGSAGQADRMRASAEAQAGAMIAQSELTRGQGTAQFIQDAANVVTTGATQYAAEEYQTGETAIEVDGVQMNLNIQKIEDAHKRGLLSTDQANLAKRKLGVAVIKHNPLADPRQVSASVFRQDAFKKTQAEIDAAKRQERDAKFEDETLHKSGLYRPNMSPEERQGALEAAIRLNNIDLRLKNEKERVGAKNELYAANARNFFLTGTGNSDFYKGVEEYRSSLKGLLLDVSNMNVSAEQKRIMIGTAVADTVASLQAGSSSLLTFAEGKTALDSAKKLMADTAKGYTDGVLTGSLTKDQMVNQKEAYKAQLDHDFNMKFGNTQRLATLSKTYAEIAMTNPALYTEARDMANNLSRSSIRAIENKTATYSDLKLINIEDTPRAATAQFGLNPELYEKGSDEYLSYQNNLASTLKSWAHAGNTEGADSNIPADAYAKVPAFVSTKAKYDALPENTKEGLKDFYLNAGLKDFLPNSLNSLQREIASKGVAVDNLAEKVAMTVNQNKVVFVPREDSVENRRVADLMNQSNKTTMINNFLVTTPHVLGLDEARITQHLNVIGNPALFNVEPTFGEQAGAATEAVLRVGKEGISSTALTTNLEAAAKLHGWSSEIRSQIAESLSEFGEDFMKGFKKEEAK